VGALVEGRILATDHTGESGSLATVRAINTTALRAAKAWSVRATQAEAWREISSMFGVLLSFLPPGEGPATPIEMIENLRRPMREWVSLPWESLPDELGAFPILGGDDDLTSEAVEYGSDYIEALFENHEADTSWIPQWAVQTFEKVERSVYMVLVSAGQDEYVSTRQLLIEVPVGSRSLVRDEINARGALRTEAYIPLPPDQQFTADGSSWYVPCPECRWPMHVHGALLRCRYPQHSGTFHIAFFGSPTEAPVVTGPVPVEAASAVDVVSLHHAVWRYITVPGVTEVGLMRWLTKHPGVEIDRWPHKDRWDITARVGKTIFEIDLKDVRYPSQIGGKPPRVRYVVVPDYRAWQIAQLKRTLPKEQYTACTVRTLKVLVRKALGEKR
jgi:hypothetical protein